MARAPEFSHNQDPKRTWEQPHWGTVPLIPSHIRIFFDTRALQHYLGHRNIMHTVRYTELRTDRFDGFWKD